MDPNIIIWFRDARLGQQIACQEAEQEDVEGMLRASNQRTAPI
jgi:hypothetical protein